MNLSFEEFTSILADVLESDDRDNPCLRYHAEILRTAKHDTPINNESGVPPLFLLDIVKDEFSLPSNFLYVPAKLSVGDVYNRVIERFGTGRDMFDDNPRTNRQMHSTK